LAEQHKILTTEEAFNRVAVTSNGILRFVYRFITGTAPGPDARSNRKLLRPNPTLQAGTSPNGIKDPE
jgi:hypothetical protein